MEDYLKKQKFEYISNHWSDLPQTLNLGFYDLAKFFHVQNDSKEDDLIRKMTSNGRLPKMAII